MDSSYRQYKIDDDWFRREYEQKAAEIELIEDERAMAEFQESLRASDLFKGWSEQWKMWGVFNDSVQTMRRVLGVTERKARFLTRELILNSIELAQRHSN